MDQRQSTVKQELSQQNQVQKQYLAVPEIFSYEYFESHRYQISDKDIYQCLCNNGFIKLFTLKTRVYWHAQNQFQHKVPDWKLHVSVMHEDLKKAWNLIVGIFLKMKCRAGMKTIYLKQATNPQIGRQITLYIVKYSRQFENSAFANDYQISVADQHSQDFWFQMISQIQRVLELHEVRTNGLAQGDLQIGKYVSLRNQAFVLGQDGHYIYPPNHQGWNPKNQKLPFNLNILMSYLKNEQQMSGKRITKRTKNNNKFIFFLALPILIVSFGFVWSKQLKKM